MQFKAALLIAAASVASADILSDLALVPSCILNCYAVTAVLLGCDPTDVACVCKQESDLLSFGAGCAEQYCSDEDLLMALVGIESVCEDVAADPPPSSSDYAAVSSVITSALGGGSTPTATFSVHAADPTTIQGTTIVSGTATRTVAPIVIQSQTKPAATKTTSTTGGSSSPSPTKNAAAGGHMEAGAAVMGGAVLAAVMML